MSIASCHVKLRRYVDKIWQNLSLLIDTQVSTHCSISEQNMVWKKCI